MPFDKRELLKKAARRGKYFSLYNFLLKRHDHLIAITFRDLEEIVGFRLPYSAYRHRAWWANQAKYRRPQAMAWEAAGWKTVFVNMETNTLKFKRTSDMAGGMVD